MEINNIICDLDGTFIKGDSSLNFLKKLILHNPFILLKVLFILLFYGKARVKAYIFSFLEKINFEYQVNQEVLKYLQKAKKDGKFLVLATGSNIQFAKSVANKFNIFDAVIASENEINCIGEQKLKRIKLLLKNEPFLYIGNDLKQDFIIWEQAHIIGLIGSHAKKVLKNMNKEIILFERVYL